MKTNKLILLGLFLLLAGLSTQLTAQTNLDAWAKKVESIKDVDITVIIDKDRETKKERSKMISISFEKNPTLASELRAAAAADKKDAIKIIENKESGTLSPQVYEFYDTVKKQTTKYIFSFDEDETSLVVKTDFPREAQKSN